MCSIGLVLVSTAVAWAEGEFSMSKTNQHEDRHVFQFEQSSSKDRTIRKLVSKEFSEDLLDEALRETFPASDPVASQIFE